MKSITVETKKLREVINITPQVEKLLDKHPAEDGMTHLYLRHTTAALTTAFIEDEVDLGMLGAFETMLPESVFSGHSLHQYGHTHHIGHLPAHVVASMLGPHLAIPVQNNKILLGTFQSIVLVELNGPQKREIVIDYKEDKGD